MWKQGRERSLGCRFSVASIVRAPFLPRSALLGGGLFLDGGPSGLRGFFGPRLDRFPHTGFAGGGGGKGVILRRPVVPFFQPLGLASGGVKL